MHVSRTLLQKYPKLNAELNTAMQGASAYNIVLEAPKNTAIVPIMVKSLLHEQTSIDIDNARDILEFLTRHLLTWDDFGDALSLAVRRGWADLKSSCLSFAKSQGLSLTFTSEGLEITMESHLTLETAELIEVFTQINKCVAVKSLDVRSIIASKHSLDFTTFELCLLTQSLPELDCLHVK